MEHDRWLPVDAARLAAAQAGDMEAFTEVFEPLRRRLHALACRLAGIDAAGDIVMETYLKAWRTLPALRDPDALPGWLCRIARRTALDHLRQRQRRARHELALGDDLPLAMLDDPLAEPPGAEADRGPARATVRAALARLSDKHRTVLLLRFADELSCEEIAAGLGIRLGTVLSRLHYARRQLRNLLERAVGEGSIDV